MVDILKRRQLEIELIAKEIYNDRRYSIFYTAGKAIARHQLMEDSGDWHYDYADMIFDTKAQATKFLKQKNLDHADMILESMEIENEAYDY